MVIEKMILISLLHVAVTLAMPVNDQISNTEFKSGEEAPTSILMNGDEDTSDQKLAVDDYPSDQDVSPTDSDDDMSDQDKQTTLLTTTDSPTTTTSILPSEVTTDAAPRHSILIQPEGLPDHCYTDLNITIG